MNDKLCYRIIITKSSINTNRHEIVYLYFKQTIILEVMLCLFNILSDAMTEQKFEITLIF